MFIFVIWSSVPWDIIYDKIKKENGSDMTWNQACFKQVYFENEENVVQMSQLIKCSLPKFVIL